MLNRGGDLSIDQNQESGREIHVDQTFHNSNSRELAKKKEAEQLATEADAALHLNNKNIGQPGQVEEEQQSSPTNNLAPSDQLGYIGKSLQEFLTPKKPMESRRQSLIQGLELYVQINHP